MHVLLGIVSSIVGQYSHGCMVLFEFVSRVIIGRYGWHCGYYLYVYY